jgi:hypothetical protein
MVCDVFPPVVPPDLVHVLVVTEERRFIFVDIIVTCLKCALVLDGLDDVGDINFLALRSTPLFLCFYCSLVDYGSSEREKGIKLFRKSSFPRPSAGVSSFGGVERVVQDFKDTFHAGRPAGNFGPPVSLFNRHLGLFDYRLSHLDDDSSSVDLPPSLIQLTHVFMNASTNIYRDELTRTAAIKGILEQIFATPLIWGISQARFGIRPGALDCGDTPFFVVEVKNEAGLEGDASLQAALSYAHIATSPLVKVKSFYVLCLFVIHLLMWIVEVIELSRLFF